AGTRNGPVNYNFPNMALTANNVQPFQTHVVNNVPGVTNSPLVNTLPRSTALRSLGGLSNCFANESFMDELAQAANTDPIDFRKRYVWALKAGQSGASDPNGVPDPAQIAPDPRAVAALEAIHSAWSGSLAQPTRGDKVGKGIAFSRYETVETYVAVYAE